MNLAIALGEASLPDQASDEPMAPPKRKQRWGGAYIPHRAPPGLTPKPFVPDWSGKEPGSCPALPLKPPGGKP